MRTKLYLVVVAATLASAYLTGGCSSSNNPSPSPMPGSSAYYPGVAGSSMLTGTVSAPGNCNSGQVQIAVYAGQNAIYQTTAPANGNFSFNTTPGSYMVVATSPSTGCGAQQQITVNPGQNIPLNLTLTPGGATYAGSTPYGTNPYGSNPYGSNPYGTSSCCSWGSYGCTSSYYPGTGGAYAGAPNIYVTGKQGTHVQLKLNFGPKSNPLFTLPPYMVDGWSGELNGSGGVVVGKTTYPYFYYDLRFDDNLLQSSSGSCVSSDKVVATMEGFLKSSGYPAQSVQDLSSLLKNRIPKVGNFCIYVQDNEVLDKVVGLEMTPAPDRVTRVLFFLVPEPAITSASASSAKFKQKPNQAMLASVKAKVAPGRAVSATNLLEIYEWGVGFLMEPPKK